MNRILIVDDEETIRMLYADELTEEGFEVITSGDGSRLMALIKQQKPDLVVMEISLDKYNGLDLLQDIRNTYNRLPIIICTASPSFKHDLKCKAADDFVVKSSDVSELKRKVRSAIDGSLRRLSPATHGQIYETTPIHRSG